MQVAFLGLGAMGRLMARNLARSGLKVRAWNRTPRVIPELDAAGAAVCSTVAEAVAGAEVIHLCLLDDDSVRAVLAEVWPAAEPGAVIVDHTTIRVATAREQAQAAASRGLVYLDAPVSGGTSGADAATLTIMVGGDAGAFARVKPLLDRLGRHVRHLGPAGAGQAAKLINQLLTAVHQAAAVEALHLARRAGLDLEALRAVIADSYGASRMFERSVPVVASGDFDTTFTVRLLAKDLGLIAAWARELGASLPLLERVHQAYEELLAAGLGDKDNAVLIRRLEGGIRS
ncbi:MAG TPA: NAD(P)-dependent oxidoreductase [Bacillota bacterium]